MTARRPYSSGEGAATALGRLLREAGHGEAEPGTDAQLERLLRAVYVLPSVRSSKPGWAKWALAALLMLGVLGVEWQRHANSALTFAADGVAFGSRTIAADAGRAVDLHFSDGSAFDVEPGARLRVESSSASGAHLALIDGKTVAHVVHRAKSSWSVTAGPFEVQVTGTHFGASWDAAHERLSVELYEGSVQVVGGAFTAPVTVRAGQRLEASTGSGNWLLTSLEGPGSASVVLPRDSAAPPASDATPADDGEGDDTPRASTGARSARPARDWPALLERADFEGIVQQASELGVEHCFTACTASDLRMLADAARYSGRFALAERSLLALRQRAPSEAATAAFLMARLDESRDARQAQSWYEKYIREAPNGVYAGEAWAGKMRVLLQLGGPSAARPAAELYLQRFPNGVRAAAARRILADAPPP
jgi:hypothetical protein